MNDVSKVVEVAARPSTSQQTETTNRDRYNIYFPKSILLEEKDVVRQFLTVYSILLPDVEARLAPRQVDYLVEVIFLARAGHTNFLDKQTVKELKKEVPGKVVYTYRKDLVQKGWLEQTDGQIVLIHDLLPLVTRQLNGITLKLNFLNRETRLDINSDS